ncbi:MAG: hypothetical protein P1U89_27505 [Verrucomicrobiales bacterium]|nr:hypothetical protein [Verrucomicrobiales bacterium]
MTSTTAEPDSTDLVEAVSQLSRQQLERLLCQVAARKNNLTSPEKRESELIEKLSRGLPQSVWESFHRLQEKKDSEQLSTQDETEIAEVVEIIENHTAEKIQWLAELAGLRNQTIDELMDSLELAR